MTESDDWFKAFPIRPATEAVKALCQAWNVLAKRWHHNFNDKTHEPKLTKKLKSHLADTARESGLLGTWVAEDVYVYEDPETGERIEQRLDIMYCWNDSAQNLQLVFEFKRLGRSKQSRNQYLREKGLGRFVTGKYSRGQPVAAMVGVLLDPELDVVPPIRDMLAQKEIADELRLRRSADGTAIARPSELFDAADFDTEHKRDPSLAPPHGYIQVAHIFLPFGYPTTTRRPKKP